MNIKENAVTDFHNLPQKVLQVGEGNFLRAFADYAIDLANEKGIFNGSVIVCQPRNDSSRERFTAQNCDYTVLTRGIDNGAEINESRIITSLSHYISANADFDEFVSLGESEDLKVVISNTTEAGIVFSENDVPPVFPPETYPAKLTMLLYRRYKFFLGDKTKGLLILPCELIENNGDALRHTVFHYATEWDLEAGFTEWMSSYCCFASTLVDRIVTGYPKDEAEEIEKSLGYTDKLLDACEPFFFWAIQADRKWAEVFPVDKTGLNIVFCNDITPYRTRKVRILNGAHTLSVLSAYLDGYDTVLKMMSDNAYYSLITRALSEEIIPTIDLPQDELKQFAASVIDRFSNPYIKHRLLDISLNSVSKFKSRILGTLLDFEKEFGKVPECLAFSFAALIKFYDCTAENGGYYGKRKGGKYRVNDDIDVLEFMSNAHKNQQTVVKAVLSNYAFWGKNLTVIPTLEEKVEYYYNYINENGIHKAVELLSEK